MLALAETDIRLLEISGNDEIAVSILAEDSPEVEISDLEILYSSRLVTDSKRQRWVCWMPVTQLLPFLRSVQQSGAFVEHVYDY
jgi:hypothetical protein